MSPLDALLRPLASRANRRIAERTPARELAAELDGKTFVVRVEDTSLTMGITVTGGEMHLSGECPDEPDAAITGSLFSLARLAGPDAENAMRAGSIQLVGDAWTANAFRRLLSYGRPDPEEELAAVVGDPLARAIGSAARGALRWGSEFHDTMQQNLSEYLTEESRAAPSRYEVGLFGKEVDALRDRAARLEARLARLEAAGGD